MSETNEEEQRRRKMIIDAEVSGLAARGVGLVARGALTGEQIEALIALDEKYIADVRAVCPELCG